MAEHHRKFCSATSIKMGSVNTADVVLLQKYLIQKATLTKAQGTAADYQKDAVIDVLDLLALKRNVWKNL